ncbi:MAG: serine/threonine-protein kinase [Candidatus Hydrogenedentales bacterium]|jgi:serine/threonine protein kinase
MGSSGSDQSAGAFSPDGPDIRKVTAGFEPGDLIADRYEVVEVLGRGGMGIVYLVNDRETNQKLALKSLLPHYVTHSHAVNRFVREVRAARQLNHPCIVKVYDARQLGSLIFYTMEYVDGVSLFKWMRKRGKMGLGSVVRILSLLCHALEHAHQFTIHRDISPDNVMVLQDGSVKLLDFGLAKLLNVESAFTMIGVSLGKQQYMAPEQRISAAEVDKRADIYSLGVMFFEMLTAELPKDNLRITDFRSDLPLECNAFVKKALAERPDDRFQDARELRHALTYIYQVSTGQPAQSGVTPVPVMDAPPLPKPSLLARLYARLRRLFIRRSNSH